MNVYWITRTRTNHSPAHTRAAAGARGHRELLTILCMEMYWTIRTSVYIYHAAAHTRAPPQARAAIESMSNTELDGRTIFVREDRG